MSDQLPAKRARAGPDLKILVDDGELDVHSVILELASPVFASMLNSAMKEGSGHQIKLPGKQKSELEMFYKSLQLCTMEALTAPLALCLARWADEYQVEALKQKCDFFLQQQPVTGHSLQHAVTYSLPGRTSQCVNAIKSNVEKYVDSLKILTSRECQDHLKALWPAICTAAGLPDNTALPPYDHLENMWPFLAQAVHLKVIDNRYQQMEREVKTWPDRLIGIVPASNQAHQRARNFIVERLKAIGINV